MSNLTALELKDKRIAELEAEIERLNQKYDYQLLVKRDEKYREELAEAKLAIKELRDALNGAHCFFGENTKPYGWIQKALEATKKWEGE